MSPTTRSSTTSPTSDVPPPTDAGKRVVPDATAELRQVEQLRGRARRALTGWVTTEQARLRRLTAATVLADPFTPIASRATEVGRLRDRGRSLIVGDPGADRPGCGASPGPAGRARTGRDPGPRLCGGADRPAPSALDADAPAGTALRIRVADGALLATSAGPSRPND